MAAITASTIPDLQHKGNIDKWKIAVKSVGAETFYQGALVYADDTNGGAQTTPVLGAAPPDITDSLIGICAKTVTTTAAGQMVEIYCGGLWGIVCTTTVVEGDVGDVLLMDMGTTTTDNPADLVTGVAATPGDGDILFGKIIAVDSNDTTRCWARLTPCSRYDATATLGWG